MPESLKLDFKPVTIDDYDRIYPYTSVYGEGSCQHSPVSMYSLREKYGDAVCIKDGFLYTLRTNLCDDIFRVYLAPLGGGDLKAAFGNIISDAREHGRRVKFLSLTQKYAEALGELFPGSFDIKEERDIAEYMFKSEVMAYFTGPELSKRRREVNSFWHKYGDRASVDRIVPEDMPDIMRFEKRWLAQSKENHDMAALERESRMIRDQLEHFERLHLSGIVIRIDEVIFGFGYGTRLGDLCYDAIIEKGDRNIPYIYKVLRSESVKQCGLDCTYVNMEEDVGIPGLRALKSAYKPAYLINKFIATER